MGLGLTCRTWALASPGQSPGPRSPGPQVPGFRPAPRPCTGRDLAMAPGAPTLSRVRPCAPSPARLPLRPQTQPPLSTSRAWRGHRFGRWAGAGAATRGLGSEGSASHSQGAGRAQKRHLQTSRAWRALPCGLRRATSSHTRGRRAHQAEGCALPGKTSQECGGSWEVLWDFPEGRR